jgi:O-antigen ligase
MGLFFTLLYILAAYLAPQTLFGDTLALAHIEVVIAAVALITSLFSISGSGLRTAIQTWAIAGLGVAILCPMIFIGYLSGGLQVLIEFLPVVNSFFLIAINCRKKWHLQALVGVLFFSAIFTIGQGILAEMNGDVASGYLLRQKVSEASAEYIIRYRGLSFLNDPNDFAQFMVSLIPCMFLFWEKGQSIRNFMMVYVPAGLLFLGMYLTHSRGGMVALMAIAIVAGRRKIGLMPAIIIGMVLFVGLSAAGFSGGRDVTAGEDRMAAWSTGLSLIREHPVFGVGYNAFTDYNDITAHNTFVVCAAELGLFGAFCWILMLFVTIRNVYVTAKDPNAVALEERRRRALPFEREAMETAPAGALTRNGGVQAPGSFAAAPLMARGSPSFAFAGEPSASGAGSVLGYRPEMQPGGEKEDNVNVSDAELRRMCGLMVLMFTGFLTAGWFLSRAYTMCLYVNAGIAYAVYMMARRRGIAPDPIPAGRAAKLTVGITLALLIAVYGIVRADHFLPH